MLQNEELRYMLALQRVHGLGALSARRLLQQFGSPRTIIEQLFSKPAALPGIPARLREKDPDQLLKQADDELSHLNQNGFSCITLLDPDFPYGLRHCPDGPLVLFSRGNIKFNQRPVLSVVGSRISTPAGRENCRRLIADLAPLDPIIVSGLAYGIDICAHRAALDNGLQTVACLGHPLDRVYPSAHAGYLDAMCAHGGALSEFWSTDPCEPINFVRRNRIIAGLGEATVVVQSAQKGGSLITAQIANSYNREVFAFPGRPDDPQSKGCNNLIKSEQARLIDSAADVLYILGWDLEPGKQQPLQTQLFPELTEDEQQLFDVMEHGQKEQLDELGLKSGLPAHKVAALLIGLEMKGLVRPLPGKIFERL